MPPALTILLGTFNSHKLKEIRSILKATPIQIVGLGDAEYDGAEAIEDGDSFEANALIKAEFYARATGMITIADDSGLVIPALDGRPGLHSARYAPSPEERIARVLREMADVPEVRRDAKFVCAMALAIPDQEPVIVRGEVGGVITRQAAGEGGFGYDPIFYIPEFRQTMAQLSDAKKNEISHRARAADGLVPHLLQLAAQVG